MITTYKTGINAEKYAIDHLINLGYTILENRYKTKFGEIDVIFSYDDYIVFVEVKFRKFIDYESIQKKQINRIRNSALCYMQQFDKLCSGKSFRFDAIFVSSMGEIDHIMNAF